MGTNRLEAFSDGVIAIIITIMVLELKVPQNHHLSALRPLVPVLISYVLSFTNVGIYWNNHHHLFHASERVNGSILWANLHLLFWLSLIPFVTGWVGENYFSPWPVALYGTVLLMAGIAYYLLTLTLIIRHGRNSKLGAALGKDVKGKASILIYLAAVPLAFVSQWLAYGLYIVVALMWFTPDRRIEDASLPEEQQEDAQ